MKKPYITGTMRRRGKRDTTQPNTGTAASMTRNTMTNSHFRPSWPTVTPISSRSGRRM